MFIKIIDSGDCINNNISGFCTADIKDVFLKSIADNETKIKKIKFSVPYLAETNFNIFRFDGDLRILEKLKIEYRKEIFDYRDGKLFLKPGVLHIDSNDTVKVKIKGKDFTFIKRSDYHLLKNPYGEMFDPEDKTGKVFRDTKSNFIAEAFLNIFKATETNNEYLDDFNKEILTDYIATENKYNQIITNSYSNADEFYNVILTLDQNQDLLELVDSQKLKEYPSFIQNNESAIKDFYNKPAKKDTSYDMKNKKLKNIPLQLLVDLIQEIDETNSAGIEIVNQLQKIYTEEDIKNPNSIISKIKSFVDKHDLKESQIAKLLLLAIFPILSF